MGSAKLRLPHWFPVRVWIVPVVVAGCALGMFGGTAVAGADDPADVPGPAVTPTAVPTPPAPTTLAPTTLAPPTTTPRTRTTSAEAQPDDGPLSLCPLANEWHSAETGIAATIYEYGPASVTVDVQATSGDQSKSVTLNAGDFKTSVAFPDISPSDVRSVTVRAVGPGPLPTRCLLSRGD